MKKTKLLYIITKIDKSDEFEYTLSELSKHYNLMVVLLHFHGRASSLETFLLSKNIFTKRINYSHWYDAFYTFIQLLLIHLKFRPHITHAHLYEGSVLGLLTAYLCGIKHRIYTRHHSSLNHIYYPRAIKKDKLCNALSTHIIAVSDVVKKVLVQDEKVASEKITVIDHGINLNEFQKINPHILATLKLQYNPTNKKPVIGVISRYVKWKGINYTITAFKDVLKTYPNALLILVGNPEGDAKEEITTALHTIPKESYIQISFEKNIKELFLLFDVFVHTPIDNHSEAFGLVYLEAMCSKVPIVTTHSGIANTLLVHQKNALICDYKNVTSIKENILRILTDNSLKEQLTQNACDDVQNFSFDKKISLLIELYNSCK